MDLLTLNNHIESVFYSFASSPTNFAIISKNAKKFCRKYNKKPLGIMKKIFYETTRQRKSYQYSLLNYPRIKMYKTIKESKINNSMGNPSSSCSGRIIRIKTLTEKIKRSLNEKNFKLPKRSGAKRNISTAIGNERKFGNVKQKANSELLIMKKKHENNLKGTNILSLNTFEEKVKVYVFEHFALILKKQISKISINDEISHTILSKYLTNENFECEMTNSFLNILFKKFETFSYLEYYEFLMGNLINSENIIRQICFNIMDIGKSNRIYKTDLFAWIKQDQYSWLIYDLLAIFDFIKYHSTTKHLKKTSNYMNKNPESFYYNKRWEFTKKRAGFKSISEETNPLPSSNIWIDHYVESPLREKFEKLHSQRENSNQIFCREKCIDFNDYSKIEFTNKLPDLYFILLFIFYGEKISHLIMNKLEIKNFEIGFNKNERFFFIHKQIETPIYDINKEKDFIIQQFEDSQFHYDINLIKILIRKFYNLIDNECGLPSIITLKSFTKHSKEILSFESTFLIKSLFDLIGKNYQQINFQSFFKFTEKNNK